MKKLTRNTAVAAALSALAVVSVASTATLGYVWNRVCAFDRANGSDVMAGRMPEPAAKKPAEKTAEKTALPADTNRTVRVHYAKFLYGDGEQGTIALAFSKMPKVDDVRRAIRVEPSVGDVSVDTDDEWYWDGGGKNRYLVRLSSRAFKFRQPYAVTVRKDLAFDGGYSLGAAFTAKVVRPDIKPAVGFVHAGRYLPAAGGRVLSFESVNLSRVKCATWKVLPENIVQLLAREERQYRKSLPYWSAIDGDSDATTELSSVPLTLEEEVVNRANERISHTLALREEDGVVTNGVYLVAVGDGDRKVDRNWDYSEYRLVCVSDIGLSVRGDGYGLRVWATSLTGGRPMPGLKAKLYAANRMLLAEGETGPDGEVVLDGWDSRYEPFALVAETADGTDCSFMAIRDSMKVGEPLPGGVRPKYLEEDGCTAFVWTERGIYRHGETIMVHALLRNGCGDAPKPMPVILELEDSEERMVKRVNGLSDDYGAVSTVQFSAPEHLPSGKWKVRVLLPDGKTVLGAREIKVEEFVPPQVRVKLKDLPTAKSSVTGLTFTVAAEHLFGGPAKKITAEGLVAFSDAEFVPEGWKGFRFGDPRRGLRPNYTRLKGVFTDDRGEASFSVGMDPEWGEPKAAVRVTIQGSVFETGGRPSVTRESRVVHRYPYYLGSDVPKYLRQQRGKRAFALAQVNPDGSVRGEARRLKAKLWKIDYAYNLVQDGNDSTACHWNSQQVRRPVEIDAEVAIGADGRGKVELPLSGSGDYELVVEDEERGLSHCAGFWISASGDDDVRASLKNPSEISIAADRSVYREGDRPRITLKCPFRGFAWISVMREKTLYTRVVEVTNLTQAVELEPMDGAWAPNVDVAVSMVRPAVAGGDCLASRAHGMVSLKVRTRDSELGVKLDAKVTCAPAGGSRVEVRVESRGEVSVGERAVVTVVDEGINLLTAEKVPDPIGSLARERGGWHPLYDLYGRLLPVLGPELRNAGVKTGGDDLAGMMNRVSPVPTRRFKPLSRWQFEVALTNGVGVTAFELPEFVGEVRVTALVYNRRGTGCGAAWRKVSPKLLMLPDAPRFAAPGDMFFLTLSLFNRGGKSGEIEYSVAADGPVALEESASGRVTLADGDSRVLNFAARAGNGLGTAAIVFRTKGLGETHSSTIELPVRPAVPWDESSEVLMLRRGESFVSTNAAGGMSGFTRRRLSVAGSPVAELKAAFDYLAEYPHGCLEQTTSRVFPLLYGIGGKAEAAETVRAGVGRVASMLRASDFTMWPDCNCPPWDREVSLYAAHFLVEAGTVPAFAPDAKTLTRVRSLLKRWAFDADTNVSVYACHTLALAGAPEKDRMYSLYDLRDRLSLLSRARLARAFVRTGDPKRARELVAVGATDPREVREAAFALITLLELDSKDSRIPKLVTYLQRHRDRARLHWGTTGGNAHALLALGAYYRAVGVREGEAEVAIVGEGLPPQSLAAGGVREFDGGTDIAVANVGGGDAFVSVRRLSLPDAAAVTETSSVLRVTRRFMTSEGFEADLKNLTRGELLIGEIAVSSDTDREFSDLVVQELLPACLEPDRREVADAYARCHGVGSTKWILRSEARDDRVIVFSKPVSLRRDQADGRLRSVFHYAVRVITPGEFVLPGTSVEAMYAPELNARLAPGRICVRP